MTTRFVLFSSSRGSIILKAAIEKPFLPILFIALLAAHVAIVWILPYFPTQDGPSHIYNLNILKDLRSGGALWGDIYYQQLSLKPNLGFHIVAYPLLYLFDPLVVEKLFISAYLLLMITSVPCLLRLLDKPVFPWAFLVFPAALSYGLAMGFYSYVIALPLVLLGGGICWRIRKSGLVRQCIVITICSAIIYCFHLIGCVFFVILIITQQLVTRCGSIARKMSETVLVLLPAGLLLLDYIISSAKGPQFIATPFTERIPAVIADLVLCGSVYFSQLQIINGVMLVLVLYQLLRFQDKRDLSDVNKVFYCFCAVLVIIDVCAPSSFGGGCFFNERMPQMILLGIIPVVADRERASDSNRWGLFLLPALAIICFAVNVYVYSEKAALVKNYMSLQNASMEKKSVIMSYRKYGVGRSRVDVLAHAVSYYALRHNLINAGNYEVEFSYFPVRLLPEILVTLPSADLVNYSPQKIDFAKFPDIRYVIAEQIESRELLSKYFSITSSNDHLELWKRDFNKGKPD